MATKKKGPVAGGRAQNSEKAATRGRPFAKGKSGNPGGRRKVPDDVKAIFADATPELARELVKMAKSPKTDAKVRVTAIIHVLDRHLGKVAPMQTPTEGGAELLLRFLGALAPATTTE